MEEGGAAAAPSAGHFLRRRGRAHEVPLAGHFEEGEVFVMSTEALLELRGVHKHFGAVHALKGVDFHVSKGEVMALVGDNGAGKSTMVKAIAGSYAIDEGQILWEGEPVSISSPKDASARGIEVVYQDLARCDNPD